MRRGTLFGFPYQVHPAWLLVFAVLLVSVVTSVDGSALAELSGTDALVVGVVVVFLCVGCIVAHELSHAVVLRRLGQPQAKIQLLTQASQPAPNRTRSRPAPSSRWHWWARS